MPSLKLETKLHVYVSNDFIDLDTEVHISCSAFRASARWLAHTELLFETFFSPSAICSLLLCQARAIFSIQLHEHNLKTLLPITGLRNTKSDNTTNDTDFQPGL
jgi:hypothetical protein